MLMVLVGGSFLGGVALGRVLIALGWSRRQLAH